MFVDVYLVLINLYFLWRRVLVSSWVFRTSADLVMSYVLSVREKAHQGMPVHVASMPHQSHRTNVWRAVIHKQVSTTLSIPSQIIEFHSLHFAIHHILLDPQ